MTQKQSIDLRYVVEFPKSLSSRVGVYGLDSKRREVYGATAFMGISIEVGDQVEPHVAGGRKDQVQVKSYSRVKATTVTGEQFRMPLSELHENWEELINEGARRLNANSIKVGSPDHVAVAIDKKTIYPIMRLIDKHMKDSSKNWLVNYKTL